MKLENFDFRIVVSINDPSDNGFNFSEKIYWLRKRLIAFLNESRKIKKF